MRQERRRGTQRQSHSFASGSTANQQTGPQHNTNAQKLVLDERERERGGGDLNKMVSNWLEIAEQMGGESRRALGGLFIEELPVEPGDDGDGSHGRLSVINLLTTRIRTNQVDAI